jgi:FkbM family methyltransferase
MPELQLGTFSATLGILFLKGVRYATVIDLGCADGNFYLENLEHGVIPGATCVNVDANAMYEPSLREIRQVLGGHYAIAAISDSDGEVELRTGSHSYWASLLPPEDPYWSSSHNRPGATIKVPALTLDTLVQRFALKPPFLLKLDLQGGELAALRGGQKMLAETDTIICETANDQFPSICEFLTTRNFGLFDLTQISRIEADGTLCEFYPVFLNRRLDHIKAKEPWDPAKNDAVITSMHQRRNSILDRIAKILVAHRTTKAY